MKLHPKIRNAAIAAAILAAISILNAVANVYPDQAWTPIVDSLVLLLTGWATPSIPKGASS